ncbi:MAG: hypothetical protein K9M49_08750 [Candidatus Marinimicrobia bacterium]|nr:hypothetical protein [Candidatus Neomarinimicrobiota bacterium]MCF7851290.1 hypothetical protein [Candidatus Neomarinimicrobiota bacterium]MCF7905225.1 hypothetical protein [Candidatus Neomarinimicrobiota bacterium]
MIKFLRISILVLTIGMTGLFAQDTSDRDALYELMTANWKKIQDYEVDIRLSVKIPGFRMPSRKIHYLFKAPDMNKVETKGFAIVPKQGIQPFFTFLNDSLDIQHVKDTTFQGRPVHEYAYEDTFMNREGQIGFFIDRDTGNIYQVWAIHEDIRFFEMTTGYAFEEGIYVPNETNIQMKFPPNFRNIQGLGKKWNEMQDFEALRTDEWLDGSIKIRFSKYKINQGIPDDRFIEED